MDGTNERREAYHRGLSSLSVADGRDVLLTKDLGSFFSEGALHRYRAVVEIEQLISMSESSLRGMPKISDEEKKKLRSIFLSGNFDSKAVADYDRFGRNGIGPLEHDIKAVEVYLRERFDDLGIGKLKEFIHFPMTSEDCNNIAFNLMIRDGLNKVWLPVVLRFGDKLYNLTLEHKDVPVVGKTHARDASPTTIGKRFGYHLSELVRAVKPLTTSKLEAKFSGAVGNHNAMFAVAPEFDMGAYAKKFVENFGFTYLPIQNQRNSHQSMIRVFNDIQMTNLVGMATSNDVELQILLKLLDLEGVESHVGSSLMPHKINPWMNEHAYSMLAKSNDGIDGLRRGIYTTWLERILTDHAYERSYGEIIGDSVSGFAHITQTLGMLRVDKEKCVQSLGEAPEVLSEAVQIGGRILGVPDVYMKIKEATRGRKVTLDDMRKIIDGNLPDSDIKRRLLDLTPDNYIGIAPKLAEDSVAEYKSLKEELASGIL